MNEPKNPTGQGVCPPGARNHRPECSCGMCKRIRANEAMAAEKEQRGKKARRRLKPQQARFVLEFVDPESPAFRCATKAAELAGYSPDSADAAGTRLLRNEQVQKSIGVGLERAGITRDFLFSGLAEGLRAEEVKLATFEGKFSDERRIPDFHARYKFQEMAHRLRGDFPKDLNAPTAALILKLPPSASAEECEQYLEAYFASRNSGED